MTYIGQQPSTTFDSGIQDRFTGLSSNTVTLTHDISAETDILVVWNNIVQDSGTYSVGGTGNKTLTLGGTLVSADVVTVYYTNKVMQSVNPTAGSVNTTQLADLGVTGAKLNTDVISAQTALGATPADTDELLVSDAGVLKRVDYSYLKSTINTPYCARMAKVANQTISNSSWTLFDLASGTEVYDKGSIADLATSKITVPSGAAGFWVFNFFLRVNNFRADRNILQLYKNGVATSGTTAGDNFEMGKWDATSQYSSLFGHLVLNLAVADYIQPYFYQNSGSSETIFERSFSGWYLGASS